MPAGLNDGFEHYLAAGEEQISQAVQDGMVVVDTNVLLDAYRFAPEARAELFGALEALADRLWIPHQVAAEFHKNRAMVIAEHDAAYREATSAIREFRERCSTDLGAKVKTLAKRIALKDSESDRIIGAVLGGLDAASRHLEGLRGRHGITADGIRNDPVLSTLQAILAGKVGPRPSEEQEEKDRAEASRRIAKGVPPGYQDRRKADPHGDYLLWRQALTEAESRNLPLLLVTRDVKDDWFWRVNGRTVGARPELVRECREEAGVHLVIMTTQGFLHHAARELHTTVSSDTLRQAEALTPAGVEHITVLDRRTSSPRRLRITPELFDFVLRQAEGVAGSTVKELAGLNAAYESNRDASSTAVSETESQNLREEAAFIRKKIEEGESRLQFLAPFIDWCSDGASAGEPVEIPDNHRRLFEIYAADFVPAG